MRLLCRWVETSNTSLDGTGASCVAGPETLTRSVTTLKELTGTEAPVGDESIAFDDNNRLPDSERGDDSDDDHDHRRSRTLRRVLPADDRRTRSGRRHGPYRSRPAPPGRRRKIHTEGTGRPVRALLRCEGQREPRWWAEAGDLRSVP